jgi:hypothetical protein
MLSPQVVLQRYSQSEVEVLEEVETTLLEEEEEVELEVINTSLHTPLSLEHIQSLLVLEEQA